MHAKLFGECINFPEFQAKIERMIKAGIKLRPAFVSIASDWFKSNQQMFMDVNSNEGAGAWATMGLDLSDSYKIVKPHIRKKAGYDESAYPILVFSGRLMESATQIGTENKVEIDDKHLLIEVLVPYGAYHQSDAPRKRLPHRPFILNLKVEGVGTRMRIFEHNIYRWNRILKEYMVRQVQKAKRH